MNTTVAPFLMFEGRAEEAFTFYIATIPNSRFVDIRKYGTEGPGKAGSVMVGTAEIGGLPVMFSDSYVTHPFSFTPSMSLFVTCASEEEIERIVNTLSDGGAVLMPLDNYGFSRKFAWVNDRFGVSWQISLP